MAFDYGRTGGFGLKWTDLGRPGRADLSPSYVPTRQTLQRMSEAIDAEFSPFADANGTVFLETALTLQNPSDRLNWLLGEAAKIAAVSLPLSANQPEDPAARRQVDALLYGFRDVEKLVSTLRDIAMKKTDRTGRPYAETLLDRGPIPPAELSSTRLGVPYWASSDGQSRFQAEPIRREGVMSGAEYRVRIHNLPAGDYEVVNARTGEKTTLHSTGMDGPLTLPRGTRADDRVSFTHLRNPGAGGRYY